MNPQTTLMCAMLGIRDVTAEILKAKGGGESLAPNLLLRQAQAKIDQAKVAETSGTEGGMK